MTLYDDEKRRLDEENDMRQRNFDEFSNQKNQQFQRKGKINLKFKKLVNNFFERDDEISKDNQWIYTAYYNANDEKSFIGKWLSYLNHGNIFTFNHGEKQKIENNNLDDTVRKYRKKAKKLDKLSVLLAILSLIPIILPIYHLSFILGSIGIICWILVMCLMSITISDNILVTKLLSRERIVKRHGEKYPISREDIVTEQRNQVIYMLKTLSKFVANEMTIAINFFIFPILNMAINVSKINLGMFSLTGDSIKGILGNGFITHLILIVIVYSINFSYFHMVQNQIIEFKNNVDISLSEQRYRLLPLHQLINGKRPDYEANVIVGQSLITGDNVVLNVSDRANGVLVSGPNGAGKTGSIFKPFISQDLMKFVRWFRKSPELLKRDDYNKHGVASQYLNGLIVMETTNSLCEEVEKLANKVLGIPREMIRWLDPGNNDSDTINLMRGPSNGVANTIVSCIGSLSESTNSESANYFEQSQRSWLQNYVLLVKDASVFIDVPVTFDDLFSVCLDVSNSDQYIEILEIYKELLRKARVLYYLYARKHKDLRVPENREIQKEIETYKLSGSSSFKQAMQLAEDEDDLIFHENMKKVYKEHKLEQIDQTKLFIAKEQLLSNLVNYPNTEKSIRASYNLSLPFDEVQTTYKNIDEVLMWFDLNVAVFVDAPKVKDDGNVVQSPDQRQIETLSKSLTPKRKGKLVYFDRQETAVKGVKVTLNQLAENKYVRRIFFNLKENDNFSIDNFFHAGGLLLLYTGKSVKGMSMENARMIAKIEQSIIFSAGQRRKVDNGAAAEPMIPFYFDEHIDFMNKEYVDVTGQVRKYNTPMLSVIQSPAQIDNKFGKAYRKTLMGTMRTKISFGDVEAEDGEYYQKVFGTHQEFVKQRSSREVQGPHNDSSQIRGSFQEEPNITASQLENMQEYTLAIRTNVNNSPMPFDHIKVKQVNEEKLKNSDLHVDTRNNTIDQQALDLWRENMSEKNPDFEGIDDIFHEYYLRVKAYFDNGEVDIYKEQEDYNHEFETLENNIENTLQYAESLDQKTNIFNYRNVPKQDNYVTGVPDWVFEELRDSLFNKDKTELTPELEPNLNKSKKHNSGRAGLMKEDELQEHLNVPNGSDLKNKINKDEEKSDKQSEDLENDENPYNDTQDEIGLNDEEANDLF